MSRGFTIIEVMVVVSIIAILSSILMFQFRSFDSQLLVRNVAYEIAGTLREAQLYGVSVRGNAGAFTAGYGVHFVPGTTYIVFRDVDSSKTYTSGDVTLATSKITGSKSITNLCSTACAQTSLDIIFTRPNPDAAFAWSPSAIAATTSVEIHVGSNLPGGTTRRVVVSETGQISVK